MWCSGFEVFNTNAVDILTPPSPNWRWWRTIVVFARAARTKETCNQTSQPRWVQTFWISVFGWFACLPLRQEQGHFLEEGKRFFNVDVQSFPPFSQVEGNICTFDSQ